MSWVLCSLLETRDARVKLEDILVTKEFLGVFPDDLPSVLIERKIKFGIDVMLGMQPILRAPYRIVLVELKKLKTQLQGLLDKGFKCPSVSISRSSSLFYN